MRSKIGAGYDTNYNQAPRALVTAWGDIFHGSARAGTPKAGLSIFSMSIQTASIGMRARSSCADVLRLYNTTGRPDWGLGASSLDDPATARSTAYGPWRAAAEMGTARHGADRGAVSTFRIHLMGT
jgi:hypothetical protein